MRVAMAQKPARVNLSASSAGEFRLYHRAGGLVVKERDDLMCATRYGLMMLRHAASEASERNYWKPIDYSRIPLGIV